MGFNPALEGDVISSRRLPARRRLHPRFGGGYPVFSLATGAVVVHPRPRGGIRVPSTSASAARRFIPALGGTRTNTTSSPSSSWLIPARAARCTRVRDPEGRATARLGVVFGVARAPTRTRRLARLRQYDAPAQSGQRGYSGRNWSSSSWTMGRYASSSSVVGRKSGPMLKYGARGSPWYVRSRTMAPITCPMPRYSRFWRRPGPQAWTRWTPRPGWLGTSLATHG